MNLNVFFEFYKFRFKYNVISFETETILPTKIYKDLNIQALPIYSLGRITRIVHGELLQLGFSPSGFSNLRSSIEDYAKEFSYNPVEDYFRSLDKIYNPAKDPFSDLFKTLKLQEHVTSPTVAKGIKMYMRKWFIQVASAACTSDTWSDKIFNNVLIFTGRQGIGKTRWVQSLFPAPIQQYCTGSGSIDVHSFRSDKVKQAIELQNTLICNINEIDMLFKKKTYSAFKSMLDENTAKMVLPYGRSATTMVRRTVFIGSTNKEDFLVDQSGNRRISIIPVEDLEFEHDIDLDQLWAHVMHWYLAKEKWWLDGDKEDEASAKLVQTALNAQNMYMGDEFLVEEFDNYFDPDKPERWYRKMQFKNVRAVIPQLSSIRVNSHDFRAARESFTLWLKQTRYGKIIPKSKKTRAPQYYLVPPLKNTESVASFRQVAQQTKDN